MNKAEEVYKAVLEIIDRRKAEGRHPECALRREIVEAIAGKGIDHHELTRLLMQLVREGKLFFRPAINDQSYYLQEQ